MELDIGHAAEDVRREAADGKKQVGALLELALWEVDDAAALPRQRNQGSRAGLPELQAHRVGRGRRGRIHRGGGGRGGVRVGGAECRGGVGGGGRVGWGWPGRRRLVIVHSVEVNQARHSLGIRAYWEDEEEGSGEETTGEVRRR